MVSKMTSCVLALLMAVVVSRHHVIGDSLGQLCLEAETVGTSETLQKICQEYYQYSDDDPSNDNILSKLPHLRSPSFDSNSDTYDGDKNNDHVLRRTLLALLPSRSAYLRQLLASGDHSGSVDDDNKSDKRDGNYIRFGKKQYSQFKRTGPMVRSYLASFGTRDKKPAGQYMRFGRSIAIQNPNNSVSWKENDVLAASETKNVSKIAVKSPDWKRERFDRGPAVLVKDKRLMRFGRVQGKDDESTVEDYDRNGGNELPIDARFFRFGRNFMRFGRANASPATDSNNAAAKRYMRFGKRQNTFSVNGARQQKRFMRFGRDLRQKRFMRFGKAQPGVFAREPNVVADDAEYDTQKQIASEIQPEKRFMRFGKRTDDGVVGDNSSNAAHKRFMRFGKRTLVMGERSPKRFMRFGKSVDTPAVKNHLRLWKKSSQRTAN